MQNEIYFVLNEAGELCTALGGSELFEEKESAENYAADCHKTYDEPYTVATYVRAGASILTCVYCGLAYPSGTPTHGAKLLTDHIKVCEKHPLRAAEARIAAFEAERYEIWARGYRSALFGESPSDNPYPEPPDLPGAT